MGKSTRQLGMRSSALPLVALCSLAGGLAARGQTAPPQPSEPSVAAATQIEEVVVTAQKRETTLEKTPDAITVLSGATLTARGNDNLAALEKVTPNLSFSQNFGITQVFIRGIGNNFFSPGGDPGVATYNDGAYVSDQESTGGSFFDLSRVEVLRGPQGSLYGRNATGGAINVISAPPTATFTGEAGLTVGDYGRIDSEGFVSGPVGFDTRVRLSFQTKSHDGYSENELKGAPGAPGDFDDQDSRALRLQTLTNLPGGGTLHLIAGWFDENDTGPAEKVLPDPFPQPAQILFGATPSGAPRSLKSQLGVNKRDVWSVVGQYDQPVGRDTFTLIGSYRSSHHTIAYDQDGTEANQSTTRLVTRSKDYSVDARLASPDTDRLRWIVGLTYVDFTQDRVTYVFDQIPLGFVVPGAPLTVPFPVDFSAGGQVRTRSIAGYGDLHFALTPRLRLLGGLRYTSDRKSADEFLIFAAPPVTDSPSHTWSNVSGKLGAEYDVARDVLAYGNVSRGFKSGAINLGGFTPPVKPEIVDNVELGLKSQFWERRAQLNLAAFYSKYRDLQVLQIDAISTILSNAARAEIKGVEAEALLKPVRGLTFNANLSYLDAEYTDFVTPDVRRGLAAVDVSGNRLPLTARYQAALGGEYARTVAGFEVSGRIDYAWRDKVYFTEFNTPDAEQSAYGTVDLSAQLSPIGGRWRAFAYLQNATDERAIGSLAVVSPLLGAVRLVNLIPPLHFGVGAAVRF